MKLLEKIKDLTSTSKVGDIHPTEDSERLNFYYYISADGFYKLRMFEPKKNHDTYRKKYQDAERQFNLFKKELRKAGFLNKPNPIFKFETMGWHVVLLPNLEKYTLPNLEKYNQMNSLLDFDVSNGKSYFLRTNNAIHFLRTQDNRYYENTRIPTDQEKTILTLKSWLKNITEEMGRQGYKADHKHIATLIALHAQNPILNLVGDIKVWIPYVCADIKIEKLYEILSVENNPGYRRTGKIEASVETAKLLATVHNSFIKELLAQD